MCNLLQVIPNGQDDIENVRLIRDSESFLCKGIGYMLLKNGDAVMGGLSLHEVWVFMTFDLSFSGSFIIYYCIRVLSRNVPFVLRYVANEQSEWNTRN